MRRGAAWVALAVVLGCDGGPLLPFITPARFEDPAGDTFETAASANLVPPDLIALEISRPAGALRFALEFAEPVSPDPTSRNFLSGFLELDLDQDAGTGLRPSLIQQLLEAAGPRELGVELEVRFSQDGMVRLTDPIAGTVIGILEPVYDGRRLIFDAPLALLGDDGLVTFALIVGTALEPTDVAPDMGVIRIGAP